MKDLEKENYLMKVWNYLVGYFEDYDIEMTNKQKLKFAQGYLYGLKMFGSITLEDYIKFNNDITDIIIDDIMEDVER